ncbi:hypothetical protein HZ996_05945 [Cryomorphaceae bacterium]|nr:hypothetical protein HZ996_05945 [Cryomorphaceae bacterium]
MIVIEIFLDFLAAYAAIGFVFALFIVFFGASRLDAQLANSPKGVRVLLFPGILATWPVLLMRYIKNPSKS